MSAERINPATGLPNTRPQMAEERLRERRKEKALRRSRESKPPKRKHGR